MRKEGERLVIEPAPPRSLLALLRLPRPDRGAARRSTSCRIRRSSFERPLSSRHQRRFRSRPPPGRSGGAHGRQGRRSRARARAWSWQPRSATARLRRARQHLSRQLEEILEVLPVLPLEVPADRFYGLLRAAWSGQAS